jgi:REP element-mobilizing transposase RayT
MNLTSFTSLSWAYQLHYYICFRTHRRRTVLNSSLFDIVNEICNRHDLHLLDYETYPDQLRCLISLQPDQGVAKAIQTLKTNASREWNILIDASPPLWANGYLARSVGSVRIGPVRNYLEQQSTHHGYDQRWRPPVYRYRAEQMVSLTSPHAFYDLRHHLVLATSQRKGIFSSDAGHALVDYWLRVAAKRDFAIDQITVVPDHVHSIVRIKPTLSIEACALLLMNNGQHFIGEHFPEFLIQAGVNQLWQPSAYAGTCGEYTSALIKNWLNSSGK